MGVLATGGDVSPPPMGVPIGEGEAGNPPLGDKPPTPIIPMRELTDGRKGCSTGARGGDMGKEEDGEGEMRGEGRNIAPPSACCCCWCMRAMATLVVAAAVWRGAWTSGAQITGLGLGDTVPLPPMAPPRPAAAAAMASCMAGMLSCLTICCTSMLSQEPRPPMARPAPAPGPPPPRPPPRPILPPATEPPWDDFRRSIEFFLPTKEKNKRRPNENISTGTFHA